MLLSEVYAFEMSQIVNVEKVWPTVCVEVLTDLRRTVLGVPVKETYSISITA